MLRVLRYVRPPRGALLMRSYTADGFVSLDSTRRDVVALQTDLQRCREKLHTSDFGDLMEQCTAEYQRLSRDVALLGGATKEDLACDSIAVVTDVLPRVIDTIECDTLKQEWRRADDAWSDLIVDASLQ